MHATAVIIIISPALNSIIMAQPLHKSRCLSNSPWFKYHSKLTMQRLLLLDNFVNINGYIPLAPSLSVMQCIHLIPLRIYIMEEKTLSLIFNVVFRHISGQMLPSHQNY